MRIQLCSSLGMSFCKLLSLERRANRVGAGLKNCSPRGCEPWFLLTYSVHVSGFVPVFDCRNGSLAGELLNQTDRGIGNVQKVSRGWVNRWRGHSNTARARESPRSLFDLGTVMISSADVVERINTGSLFSEPQWHP